MVGEFDTWYAQSRGDQRGQLQLTPPEFHRAQKGSPNERNTGDCAHLVTLKYDVARLEPTRETENPPLTWARKRMPWVVGNANVNFSIKHIDSGTSHRLNELLNGEKKVACHWLMRNVQCLPAKACTENLVKHWESVAKQCGSLGQFTKWKYNRFDKAR